MAAHGMLRYRRLIGLGCAMAVLLLVTVTVTSATGRQRADLLRQRDEAREVADSTTELRFAASDLFGWQIASAMGVLERRSDALDPNRAARQQYLAGLASLRVVLEDLEARPLDATVRQQTRTALDALDQLEAVDREVVEAYSSADRRRADRAAELTTSVQIDRYQSVAGALSRLALVTSDEADRLARASGTAARQGHLVLIGMTAAMLTTLAGVMLWVWRGDRRHHEAMDRLVIAANVDPLTNLANRRRWDEALSNELRRAAAVGQPLSVVLVDLDHFKAFNDTFGHPAGDRHLRAIADLLVDVVRRDDVVARLGGEEFGLLLRGTSAGDAARVIDRVRPGIPDAQTLSAGVAEWDGQESATDLVARADLALYEAKAAGRNASALAHA